MRGTHAVASPGVANESEGQVSFDAETTLNLLEEARSGNNIAVELLCRRYLAPLQRWARGRFPARTPEATPIDDLCRDTLKAVLPRLDALEHLRAGALLGLLRQSVLDRVRDERDGLETSPTEAATAGRPPLDHVSPIEEQIGRTALNRYEGALAELPPREQEAVIARVELGLDYDEIADLLGSPDQDAARRAVSRALLRLARAMEEPGL
jgi:DNA-directed RNA polymerase specialized sigma24 family protein